METQTYYVIKPTTHNRAKVSYGDSLELTAEQARPLINGGFIGTDLASAIRIGELATALASTEAELKALQDEIAKNTVDTAAKADASKAEVKKA